MKVPDFACLDAVIVDLDGTLVDTLGDFTVAMNATLCELGLSALFAPQIERMVGKGSEFLIRAALEAVGAAPGLFGIAWDGYQRHYGAINGRHARVYPGAREGLRRLHDRKLKLVCLTNKPQAFAEALLEDKDLAGFFDAVFGGDAFEERKPHPLPLQMACRVIGVQPERTLVLGDSVNDALAARAAGCPVVLVRYGYNHGQPVETAGADAYVDAIADLLP